MTCIDPNLTGVWGEEDVRGLVRGGGGVGPSLISHTVRT